MPVLIPFLLLAVAPVSSPADRPNVPARVVVTKATASAAAPRVEVAFVLDTTGSMGGLIDGAKRKIWSIARRIGEGRPRPDLRIALVGYRDVADEYVTLVHDFSRDMDEVNERLMAFQASGGGDGPEHVSAALGAAVDRLSWSRSGRPVAPSYRKVMLAVLRRARREGRVHEPEPEPEKEKAERTST